MLKIFKKIFFKSFKGRVGYMALPFPNYGSVLQSVALYKTIKNMGWDCRVLFASSFLNKPKPTTQEYQEYDSNLLTLEQKKQIENKHLSYMTEKFIKSFFNFEDLDYVQTVKNYDAYVCGSDQILRPADGWIVPLRRFNLFPSNKKIIYAGSVGTNKIMHKHVSYIPEWRDIILSFNNVSVREKTASALIEKICHKKTSCVLDPTLLFNSRQWLKLVKKKSWITSELKKQMKKKYVLAYLLHGYSTYKDIIEKYALKNNVEIIWLVGTDTNSTVSINRLSVSPGGFIKLVSKASAVFTDSFHGCCFSIIFQKNFVSCQINGMDKALQIYDVRKYDLLDRLGITERSVNTKTVESELTKKINWNEVVKKLNKEKEYSLLWLSNALLSSTKQKKSEKEEVSYLKEDPSKKKCTGCGACANICPQKAITIEMDNTGFFKAKVNPQKCNNCGLCKKVCPLSSKTNIFYNKIKKCYAVYSLNHQEILLSASGGAFFILSDFVFKNDGVVYGVAWTKDWQAQTVRCKNMKELEKVHGSKYVQSTTGYTFQNAKKDLDSGKYVLFSGSACQIAGLYQFLGHQYGRLITVDFLCSGFPNQLILNKYLHLRQLQAGSEIKNINMTFKGSGGWSSRKMYFEFMNHKRYENIMDNDPFGFMHLNGYSTNECCQHCLFKGGVADFSIGDFWGIRRIKSYKHPIDQGISALITNTIKSNLIWEKICKENKEICCEERSLDEIKRYNPIYTKSKRRPYLYDKILNSFLTLPFDEAFKECFGSNEIRSVPEGNESIFDV